MVELTSELTALVEARGAGELSTADVVTRLKEIVYGSYKAGRAGATKGRA